MNTRTEPREGFTLIELLPVLMIIGIQAAIFFPGVQGVMRSNQKSASMNKLRVIGQGYMSWSLGTKTMTRSGNWTPDGRVATKVSEYAANLATDPALNSGELWFVEGDALLERYSPTAKPQNVLLGLGSGASIDPLFIDSIREATGTSWTVYADTSISVAGNALVPLAWTRGLETSGLWAPADGTVNGSVWGTEGGHIVYGDGHVSWCSDTLVTGSDYFTDRNGAPTANWLQSRGIPATAKALPQQ